MKILILEHNRHFSGHRVPYARRIAEAVQSIAGTQVIVGFPEPIRSEKRLADYFPQSDPIETTFYPLPESKDGLTHCRRVASQFWQMVATLHPDYVLIPTADKLATVLAVQMQTRYRRQNRNFSTDILLMRSDLQSGRISLPGIRNQLDRQVVRWGGWNRVLHLDPLTWSRSRGRLELCPDPVPALDQSDRHQARQLLNLPARQPIIASLGNQNHDKGVDQLLRAFFHGPHCDDFCLLLAGPMSRTLAEQVRQYTEIGKGKSRLIVWDRYLSETQFQRAMIAADVIAVPYRLTERPSGIVCRAIAWERPLAGSNHGWIDWACNRLSAGIAADVADPASYAAALQQAVTLAADYRRSEIASEFANYNTAANFDQVWRRGILEKMGSVVPIPISDRLQHAFQHVPALPPMVRPDSMPPTLKIASVLPVLGHPRHAKRISMLMESGCQVEVAAFERDYHSGRQPACPVTRLGRIKKAAYLRRLITMLRAIPKLRQILKRNQLIYASGPDMALLSVLASTGLKRPICMEVGDIRKIQVASGLQGRVVRRLDRWIAGRCQLLVATAPGIIGEYYRDQLKSDTMSLVIENKLEPSDHVAAGRQQVRPVGVPVPLRVGYFGLLRCPWSWQVLETLATRFPDRFQVVVAGHPFWEIDIQERADALPNVTFLGPYRSPQDLADIYGQVDLMWTCYPANPQPSPWRRAQAICRSNRFYECCRFKTPIIAIADSGDGQEVGRWDIGLTIDNYDTHQIIQQIACLTDSQWNRWHRNLDQLPESVYEYGDEGQELRAALDQLVAREGDPSADQADR